MIKITTETFISQKIRVFERKHSFASFLKKKDVGGLDISDYV